MNENVIGKEVIDAAVKVQNQRAMRILEVTQSVSRLSGGLFESVRHLAKVIHCGGLGQVVVSALADARTADDIGRWAPLPVQTHRVVGPRRFGFSPGLLRHLLTVEGDIAHLHGLWKFTSVAVWLWAKRTGQPYVVSPHGMLEPWALKQAGKRKGIWLALLQRRLLNQAACVRATSELEAESIRQAGVTNRIVVVPNGVHRAAVGVEQPRAEGSANVNCNRRQKWQRQALFLSRLHPKKGLLNLVEAWARVRPAGWELKIAGPDERGHLTEVRAKAREHGLGPGDGFCFAGEAWGESKWALYQEADLFVLPSFSENFGLVVAEALASGVPVITTQATPWSELEEFGCGWWIGVGVEPLVTALREATALPPEALREMGRRGRPLIEQRYDWEELGRQMAKVYEGIRKEVGSS